MTGEADVALVMTGLAGAQIAPGLYGMVSRPLVTGQEAAGMTVLALGWSKIAVSGTDTGQRTIPELPAM